jgi:hypothetical protein
MKIFNYGCVLALAVTNALALSISCMLENAKYGTCVPEIKKTPDITSPDSMSDFCNSLKSEGCKSFVADAGVTSTKCDINDDSDKELATLIYTARIGYLAYCVTDAQGSPCPLTDYLLNQTSALNGESSLTSPTPEDLKIFIEDCKKEECNARLISLMELAKAYNTAKGNDASKVIPSEMDTIILNYKNKRCDDLLNNNTNNVTASNNATVIDANANPDDNESGAVKSKAIVSTISIIILLAILFF